MGKIEKALLKHLIRKAVNEWPHDKAIKEIFREVIVVMRDSIDREANDSTVWGSAEELFLEVMTEELPNAYAVLIAKSNQETK